MHCETKLWKTIKKIENEPEQIRQSIDSIIDDLKRFSIHKEDGFRIKLCLYEALGNCFTHGNQRDPLKTIFVDIRLFTSRVIFRVADESRQPIDLQRQFPENQDALYGRGIPILLENTDRLGFLPKIGALRLEFRFSYACKT